MAIVRTDLALVVNCKCGSTVAATMLYGGVSIDEDFTDTIAEVYLRGGSVKVVKTGEHPVTVAECKCEQQTTT